MVVLDRQFGPVLGLDEHGEHRTDHSRHQLRFPVLIELLQRLDHGGKVGDAANLRRTFNSHQVDDIRESARSPSRDHVGLVLPVPNVAGVHPEDSVCNCRAKLVALNASSHVRRVYLTQRICNSIGLDHLEGRR